MARIAGVDLPREKRIEIGLTYIYGIGRPSADKILAKAEVNPDTRVRDLTDDEVKRLSAVIDETMTVEGDLRRKSPLTSRDCRRLDATEVSVIVKDSRFVVRRLRQMRELARDRRELLQTRKNNL